MHDRIEFLLSSVVREKMSTFALFQAIGCSPTLRCWLVKDITCTTMTFQHRENTHLFFPRRPHMSCVALYHQTTCAAEVSYCRKDWKQFSHASCLPQDFSIPNGKYVLLIWLLLLCKLLSGSVGVGSNHKPHPYPELQEKNKTNADFHGWVNTFHTYSWAQRRGLL